MAFLNILFPSLFPRTLRLLLHKQNPVSQLLENSNYFKLNRKHSNRRSLLN